MTIKRVFSPEFSHVYKLFTYLNCQTSVRILGSILIDENEKWSQRKYLDTNVLKKFELEGLVEVTEKQLATLEVKSQGDVIAQLLIN